MRILLPIAGLAACTVPTAPLDPTTADTGATSTGPTFTLPPDLALLVKTVMMCEGVALRLDPGFLLVPRLLPFASRIVGGEEPPDA